MQVRLEVALHDADRFDVRDVAQERKMQNILHIILTLDGVIQEVEEERQTQSDSQTADDTWHGYGLAVDIICMRNKWNVGPHFWHTLGTSARRHGLVWGGDWNTDWSVIDETFSDRPHIQWGAMRRSPSAKAVEIRGKGGLIAVWATVAAM